MLGLGLNIANSNYLVGDGSLADVIPSTVFDVDATKIESYDGTGQVWKNLIKAPADGQSQTAYDFAIGASDVVGVDDVVFNGTANSPAAYFSPDLTTFFTIRSNTNTTFLNAIHKTTGGTPFWMAVAFRLANAVAAVSLIATNPILSTNNGFRYNLSSGEILTLLQGNGTISKTSPNSPVLTIGTDYLVIHSFDGSNVRRWINTNTKVVDPFTYNTATANGTNPLVLMRNAPSGTRVYGVSMGNAFIDDNEASVIATVYNFRHQRTYV